MKENDTVLPISQKQGHVTVETDSESFTELEEEVMEFIHSDTLACSRIRPYMKSHKTVENSLGDLYSYKLDRDLCLFCGKKLLSCPKKDKKGYQLEPYYVKEDDRIRFQYVPCPYLIDMNRVLEHISPCDCGTTTLVEDANSLLESLFRGDNIKKQQGIASIFLASMNDINNKEKLKTGIAFACANATEKLSSSLLRLVAYLYAKHGHSVAYIDTNKYFKQLFSGYYELSSVAEKELKSLMKADAVFFENLDEMPYLDDDRLKKYLLPLFKERGSEGKVNFASLLKPNRLSSIVYRNKNLTYTKDELLSSFSSLFHYVVIHDLDLR